MDTPPVFELSLRYSYVKPFLARGVYIVYRGKIYNIFQEAVVVEGAITTCSAIAFSVCPSVDGVYVTAADIVEVVVV